MRRGSWWRIIIARTAALGGCAAVVVPADALHPQATSDLRCNQIEMLAVAGDCRERVNNDYDCTIAVHGCGKDATYHHAPGQSEWVKTQGR